MGYYNCYNNAKRSTEWIFEVNFDFIFNNLEIK